METEKYIHLFTSVEQGLPELKEGECIRLLFIFRYGGGRLETKHAILKKEDNKYIIVDFLFKPSQTWEFYTHWLDLSKLTTIERAVDFAKQTAGFCERGHKYRCAIDFVEDKKINL